MASYPGYRKNAARVMGDAVKIVDRLQNTDVTLTGLMAEYRCGHGLLMRVIRSIISKRKWLAIRKRKLAKGGVKTRFEPGHVPANKGKKIKSHPNSVKTQFKPGSLRGRAARRWRPVGTIVIRHDKPAKRLRERKRKGGGKFQGKPRRRIKTKDDGRLQDRWIPLARHLWQEQYGPVPDGRFVAHLDGDALNDDIANLCLVDHAMSLRLQQKRDPGMRKRAGRSLSKLNRHKRLSRRAKGSQRAKSIWWECNACRFEFHQKYPPSRCPKCGCGGFEQIKQYKERAG